MTRNDPHNTTQVHLYTYDLFRERVGGKLTWGCLCFYPWFYPIGVWPLAGLTSGPGESGTTLMCYAQIW